MPRRATAGASLDNLLDLALPLLRQAQGHCPRTGPGRKPHYQDWTVAAMIFCGVMKKKKSKSAQYAFAVRNKDLLLGRLGLQRLPARSTFFARYPRLWPLVQKAIELQGRSALRERVADARVVAADKSLVPARGPVWHKRCRQRGVVPQGVRGLDREAAWGYSGYHDWVWGYSFELVVTAPPLRRGGKTDFAFPLLASADPANTCEQRTLAQKLPHLPEPTRAVVLDSGYDGEDLAAQVERPAGRGLPRRRFLCPLRNGAVGKEVRRGERERRRQRRLQRHAFLNSRRGRSLYARRRRTVEPFHATFKTMFELQDHVWHRGLGNNRTQILIAVFCYQSLVRYHRKHGGRDAQVQYLLDGL